MSPTLFEKWCGFFYVSQVIVLWDGTYSFSSLKKTRKSNCLQMPLQWQHFVLSYLKTLSVDRAGVWTRDLPLSRPALSQLRQPGGGKMGFTDMGIFLRCTSTNLQVGFIRTLHSTVRTSILNLKTLPFGTLTKVYALCHHCQREGLANGLFYITS